MGIVTPTAGQMLTAAGLAAMFPSGIIARGNKTTAVGPTNANIEMPVLRVDGVPLKNGYSYLILCANLRNGKTTGTDRQKWVLRWNNAGTATISSNELGRSETGIPDAATNSPWIMGWVDSGADQTASFLLSLQKLTVSSSTLTTSTDPGGISILVIDCGITAPNTGV